MTTHQAVDESRRSRSTFVRVALAVLTLPIIYFGLVGLLIEWPFSCSLTGPRDEICGSLPVAALSGAVIFLGLISCICFISGRIRLGLISLVVPLVLSAYLLFG